MVKGVTVEVTRIFIQIPMKWIPEAQMDLSVKKDTCLGCNIIMLYIKENRTFVNLR